MAGTKFTTCKNLVSKPDLVSTVVADLPKEVFMESRDKPSSTISSSTKHKHDKESKIADAIHEIQTSHMELERSKCKLDLIQHHQDAGSKTRNIYRSRKSARLQSISLGNMRQVSYRAPFHDT